MKNNNQLSLVFLIVLVLGTLYRIIPFEIRPTWIGSPQLAIAVFAGAVIKSRKWSFALPILSLFISDVAMEVLFKMGASEFSGFYKGQWINYLLIASTTIIGFFINKRKVADIAGGLIAAPVIYFLFSNFVVWIGNGGYQRAKTFIGLTQCYIDALPFLSASLVGTVLFGGLFFGIYQWMANVKVVRS